MGMETREFLGRVKKKRRDIPLGAASFSLNILSLLMPISILLIFDRVIPFQSTETLRMLTLVLLVGAAMELVLRWARSVLLNISAEEAAISNYQHFMHKVVSANTVSFSSAPRSCYFERFIAVSQLRDHHSGQNQTLAIDMPFTLLFAVMIGLIGGPLVLVPLGAFCVALTFTFFMKRAQWTLFSARKTVDGRRYAFLAELLTNMATIKSNRMERQMTRRFEMLEEQTVGISQRLIQFSGLSQNFGAVFSQLTVASMGLFGAFLVIRGTIGIAELAACMLLNGRIIQPLTKLMTLWVQSENVAVSRAKLEEMDAIESILPPATQLSPIMGSIAFSNVSMARLNRSGMAFEGADFTIDPGTTLLVEAKNPWMVRAFIEGLAGQRAPTDGKITIDGCTAKDRVTQRGRKALVVLENEPAILGGSLLENLAAFGDAEQVERAKYFAAQLGLEKRIHRLPKGYNTKLNTGTTFEKDPVNRQLIALTRALALEPHILVMHEPTAVLDTAERDALSQCLATLSPRPTLIMASPDPRMRRLADRTVTLELSEDAWHQDADAAMTLKLQQGAA
ncbi:Alpha-hemolysin translocation ATP-binding protein HlyB [Tritonibacter multivorans]|uniref:Alpha-hemolysin translocation ATP-binding protein HlyB n=2 Tax=Tritonibacter multivorans TaxID=928856 RepID=A0A0P1GB13_9RHOB|nr:Alpha-hemolysin translocation ATP-binding protein HlyB [Tritonibacter multivorans]SFD18876.1 ATP-binding cassette, subfamily C, LapB [Tritonibacter multivorans]